MPRPIVIWQKSYFVQITGLISAMQPVEAADTVKCEQYDSSKSQICSERIFSETKYLVRLDAHPNFMVSSYYNLRETVLRQLPRKRSHRVLAKSYGYEAQLVPRDILCLLILDAKTALRIKLQSFSNKVPDLKHLHFQLIVSVRLWSGSPRVRLLPSVHSPVVNLFATTAVHS